MLDRCVADKLAQLEVAHEEATLSFRRALCNFFPTGMAVVATLGGPHRAPVPATVVGIELDCSLRLRLATGAMYSVRWPDVSPAPPAEQEGSQPWGYP